MENSTYSNVILEEQVEQFLRHQISDLPVLGNSAFDLIFTNTTQINPATSLVETPSEEAILNHEENHSFGLLERMSPDSTSMFQQSNMIEPTSKMFLFNETSGKSHNQIPDSTTSSVNSCEDSDAFNSEDSNSSFMELQDNFFQSSNNNMCASNEDSVKTVKKLKKTKRSSEHITLSCQECSYTTRFKEHLTSHMNTHAEDRNFMCQDCGQTFKWSHSLRRHQRTHQTNNSYRFVCRFCLKTFSRKDHLTTHELQHSQTSQCFVCPECGANFKNKKTLLGHQKTHSMEKAFPCTLCNKEFTRRASLSRHMQSAHSGLALGCQLCPAVFTYRSALEDHKKAKHNEGKKDYGCEICGLQFATKPYLTKHMATCRNRFNGRYYACNFCEKKFLSQNRLYSHTKQRHNQINPSNNIENHFSTSASSLSLPVAELTSLPIDNFEGSINLNNQPLPSFENASRSGCYQTGYTMTPTNPVYEEGYHISSKVEEERGQQNTMLMGPNDDRFRHYQSVQYFQKHSALVPPNDNIGSLLRLVNNCTSGSAPDVCYDNANAVVSPPISYINTEYSKPLNNEPISVDWETYDIFPLECL